MRLTGKKVLIVVLLFAALTTLSCWLGHNEGYSWGLAGGYSEGYTAGRASFPRLEMEDVTLTDSRGNSIYIGQMVITGEQHIIDKVRNLPSLGGIIDIKSKEDGK